MNLNPGDAVVFAHGFNVHFDQIKPNEDNDIYLVSPKGPGFLARRLFTKGNGLAALVAVYQDYTGKCRERAFAQAAAIGSGRVGIIETSFMEETETDLFGEQAVLCGGLLSLIQKAFETLTEAGYSPEASYFECMHELKLIVDLFYKGGLNYMNYSVSDTAEYGGYTRGTRVVDEMTRDEMVEILAEIQDGSFAKEWILENQAGRPVFNALRRMESEELIEEVGAELRQMMPWLKEKK